MADCSHGDSRTCVVATVFSFLIGPSLTVVCLSQLVAECFLSESLTILPKSIHRGSLWTALLYTFGWCAKLYSSKDEDSLVLAGTSILFLDLLDLSTTCLLFFITYLLLRGLYRTHSLQFDEFSFLFIFLLALTLCGSCVLADILAAYFNVFWPRTILFIEIMIIYIAGVVTLWHRWNYLYHILRNISPVPPFSSPFRAPLLMSDVTSSNLPTALDTTQINQFRFFLYSSTFFTVVGLVVVFQLSITFILDPDRTFLDTSNDNDRNISIIFAGVLQILSLLLMIWLGWMTPCDSRGMSGINDFFFKSQSVPKSVASSRGTSQVERDLVNDYYYRPPDVDPDLSEEHSRTPSESSENEFNRL